MNQFNSQSQEIPERVPDVTSIDSGRLAELKKDVDKRRGNNELAKEFKDIAPAAAALIVAMVLESFNKKSEAKEVKTEKPSKGISEAVIALPEAQESKIKPKSKAETETAQRETVTKSAELPNASDTLMIGDSIPYGMISRFKEGKKPDYIGGAGKSTPMILTDARNNREILKGKKTVVISCGGNDMVSTDNYEKVADNIDAIIEECEQAGIKEIILLTRFPYQKDYTDKPYLKDRSRHLREVILRRFHEPRVKVVDLYKYFVDEKGDLKEQYASKGKDKLHPTIAYMDAWREIAKESGVGLDGLIV
jgi:lysophospholipase L1-like esterase